jgi:AcrR family transcriptional regulator
MSSCTVPGDENSILGFQHRLPGKGSPGPVKFAASPPEGPSLAEQAANRSTADLVAARAGEAQRLMDAGTTLMVRLGTGGRPTVAEIVREAGLSNQAFYRHFASKDDLVAAIVDAGARRLAGYVEHRMAAHDDPVDQIRAWVAAVFAQVTDPKVAEPTRAVAWNRNVLDADRESAARAVESLVWAQLEPPLAALGRAQPRQDAYLIGKLVFGVLTEALWSDEAPSEAELAFVADFCVAGVTAAERP